MTETLIAGLNDVAMLSWPIEQRGDHPSIAEHKVIRRM
jgi:hypothetical protein